MNFLKYVLVLCLVVVGVSGEGKLIIKQFNSFYNSRDILIDGKYIWISTIGGLIKQDIQTGKIIKTFNTIDKLGYNYIQTLFKDSDNNIFAYGSNGVLSRISNNLVQKNFIIHDSSSFTSRNREIIEDNNKAIWTFSFKKLVKIKNDEIKFFDIGFDIQNLLFDDKENKIFLNLRKNGIIEIDPTNDTLNYLSFNIENIVPLEILKSKNGALWVYDANNTNLIKLENNKITNTFNSNILPNRNVTCLFEDSYYNLWVGTNDGLLLVSKENKIKKFFTNDYYRITFVFEDKEKNIWIGTSKGLRKIDVNNFSIEDITSKYVRKIDEDNYNNIWVMSGERAGELGIIKINKVNNAIEKFSNYKNSLISNGIQDLLMDIKGNIWVATDNGVNKIVNNTITDTFTELDGLISNRTLSLSKDKENNIWVGTYNGLSKITNSKITSFNKIDNEIMYILNDENYLLLGCRNELIKFDKNNQNVIKTFKNNDNSFHDNMSIIKIDEKILVGTREGLVEIDNNDIMNIVDRYMNISLWSIVSLINTKKEIIYFSTGHKNLFTIEKNEIKKSSLDEQLNFTYIQIMLEDKLNNLWLGTHNGLMKVKDNKITSILKQENGLSRSFIHDLLEDRIGNLWVGTYTGLNKIFQLIGISSSFTNKGILLNWYLHKAIFPQYKIKKLKLERGLSKEGNYEPVLDRDGNEIVFNVNYKDCNLTQVYDGCFPEIDGHTVVDEDDRKGYNLTDEVIDYAWLEGVPRYYRVVAIYEDENGIEQSLYNSHESIYVEFDEKYKPRVYLESLLGNDLLIKSEINSSLYLKATSIDRFEGNLTLTLNSNNSEFKSLIESKLKTIELNATEERFIEIDLNSDEIKNFNDKNLTLKLSSEYLDKELSLNLTITDKEAIRLSMLQERDRLIRAGTSLQFKLFNTLPLQKIYIKDTLTNEVLSEVDSNSTDISIEISKVRTYNLQAVSEDESIKSNIVTFKSYKAKREIYIETDRVVDNSTSYRGVDFDSNRKLEKGKKAILIGKVSPYKLSSDSKDLVKSVHVKATLNSFDGRVINLLGQNGEDYSLNEKGEFEFDIYIQDNGVIDITVDSTEDSEALASTISVQLIAGDTIGEAIIIVPDSTDESYNSVATELANKTIEALINRGISSDKIKYLHFNPSSLDIDSQIDIKKTTKANIAELFNTNTNWITPHLNPNDPYKSPITLYFIGFDKAKVGEAIYQLNRDENLTISEFNSYLKNLQSIVNKKLNQEASSTFTNHLPVNVIIEGANSGSWLKEIKHKGAIIVTSSNIRGVGGENSLTESAKAFSYRFANIINQGKDIETAFAEANLQILYDSNKKQEPQVEANSNGIPNEDEDRKYITGKYLEYRPLANRKPIIVDFRTNSIINRRRGFNPYLYCDVFDPDGDRVEAFVEVISPLKSEINASENIFGIFPLIEDERIPNRFKLKANLFSKKDTYRVRYFAKDSFGNYSFTKVADFIVKTPLISEEEEREIMSENSKNDDIVIPEILLPITPSDLNITDITKNQISINWDYIESDTDEFEIYLNGELNTTLTSNILNYTFKDLTPKTEYIISIKAKNIKGESEELNITTTTKDCEANQKLVNSECIDKTCEDDNFNCPPPPTQTTSSSSFGGVSPTPTPTPIKDEAKEVKEESTKDESNKESKTDVKVLSDGRLNIEVDNIEINLLKDSKVETKNNQIISTKEIDTKVGKVETIVTKTEDGKVYASAKLSNKTLNLIPPKNVNNLKIEVTQESLKSEFEITQSFKIEDENKLRAKISSNSFEIKPTKTSTFKQIQYFDGNKSITLLSGEAVINNKSMRVNEEYFLFQEKVLYLSSGWNLIALPTKEDVDNSKFSDYEVIWGFYKEWEKNPKTIQPSRGYWIKSNINQNISFNGESYKPTLNSLNGWNLLGSGEDLSESDFNSSDEVWVFRDDWNQTKEIKSSEGFWIKR